MLVELYNATNGANWADNTNWLSDEPIGANGTASPTDDEGRVSDLSLGRNGLTGEIPTELGNALQSASPVTWRQPVDR